MIDHQRISRTCPDCGAMWYADAEVCPACGASAEPIAVIILPRGYVYAYSHAEVVTLQEQANARTWPHRVFFAPGHTGGDTR